LVKALTQLPVGKPYCLAIDHSTRQQKTPRALLASSFRFLGMLSHPHSQPTSPALLLLLAPQQRRQGLALAAAV
jgi:hypothetical protein